MRPTSECLLDCGSHGVRSESAAAQRKCQVFTTYPVSTKAPVAGDPDRRLTKTTP